MFILHIISIFWELAKFFFFQKISRPMLQKVIFLLTKIYQFSPHKNWIGFFGYSTG
jgi:hypothetical protein